jgi:acetoin utilization deacetylase AcuC-like enzyme
MATVGTIPVSIDSDAFVWLDEFVISFFVLIFLCFGCKLNAVGSKGTWTAALAAVGAALRATEMIMTGECLNVFCPTRPPGHHAGRELHAMKAISNGFCVLNTVACAALYATMPLSEGGLGLSRVCVIDIDVHHGNGTQDILCSTYDPRFLYVSIHAGGPMINGVDFGDDAKDMPHHLVGNAKKGIFPGRCGDTSPHDGVLNIPLGGRVTAHALGTALVTKVSPTVERFSPDLIIISAGFDAHKNDPLNMGGLSADDFGTLTEVICKLAHKSCSGRVLSVLEGGYGGKKERECTINYFSCSISSISLINYFEFLSTVPCCRPQYFPSGPEGSDSTDPRATNGEKDAAQPVQTAQPIEKPVDTEGSGLLAALPTAEEEMVCLDLGSDMPPDMKDAVASYALQKQLNRCHAEGFIHAVREHVSGLARCNGMSG